MTQRKKPRKKPRKTLRKILRKAVSILCMTGALFALQSCDGILGNIYDEPDTSSVNTVGGQLYVDASDWTLWHYLDLRALADSVSADPDFNTSSLWISEDIPVTLSASDTDSPALTENGSPENGDSGKNSPGIYTYWYDVFGVGTSVREYREYTPADSQPEPEKWTFAVHRNNVRTNGCAVAETDFTDLDDLPKNAGFFQELEFTEDSWNETDVWTVQDRMLSGLIGNQGICINTVLSSWLKTEIPPMPPVFALDNRVFVIRLPDNSFGALQLVNYQSPAGVKCCLTINYRYPLISI